MAVYNSTIFAKDFIGALCHFNRAEFVTWHVWNRLGPANQGEEHLKAHLNFAKVRNCQGLLPSLLANNGTLYTYTYRQIHLQNLTIRRHLELFFYTKDKLACWLLTTDQHIYSDKLKQ